MPSAMNRTAAIVFRRVSRRGILNGATRQRRSAQQVRIQIIQQAGKQVSRGEDGDQGGGLFCASEVLPAQVANQDEHAADANPQDVDAPGFGRGDPGRRSGKGVL